MATVTAAPTTPPAPPDRAGMAQAQLSFKSWIENKAATPAAMGLIIALVLRSAQVWSFGAFSLAALPVWVQTGIDIVTGLCAALAMELLMSAAGAKWFSLRRDALLAQFDSLTQKREREARAALMRQEAQLYLGFTILGGMASIVGSVYFAVTSTRNSNPGAIAVDVALAAVITAGVFFFGVVYEPARPDNARIAQDAVEDRLNSQALAIAGNVANGTMTPAHVQFLKGVVSPQASRKLDALIPREAGIEYWDTPKIMRWLGLEGDAAARDIRRKLQRAATTPSLGLRRKADGRGWEAPQTAILAIFQTDIERRMLGDTAGTPNGASTALARDVAPAGGSGMGQPADHTRQTAAPARVMPFREAQRDAAV